MRAFWISLALIAAMLLLIVCGTCFARKTCEQLQQRIQQLPDTPDQDTQELVLQVQQYWVRRARGLRATVNRSMVRSIGDLVDELVVYSDTGIYAKADYRSCRTRLLGAIDEMRRSTKATFGLWS